jgi:xylulokinase
MARSILEGVAFELKNILTSFEKGSFKLREVRVTGGGAKSPLWAQIQADVYGVSVVKPIVTNAPLLGCLFIAGLGIGMFSSLKDFSRRIVRTERTYVPDAAVHNRYEDVFRVFQFVCDLLIREGFHKALHRCGGAAGAGES